MANDLVILDRDGVLNHESPDHIKSVEEWLPLPGALEAVARLSQAGIRVVLATNQSGIDRGLLSVGDLIAIQRHIDDELARLGGRIDGVFYSPDAPGSGSPLRKPRPGMLAEIADRLHVSLAGTPFVGDSRRDLEAARAAGATPVLVRTGNGEATLAAGDVGEDVAVFDDLAAFTTDYLERSLALAASRARAGKPA